MSKKTVLPAPPALALSRFRFELSGVDANGKTWVHEGMVEAAFAEAALRNAEKATAQALRDGKVSHGKIKWPKEAGFFYRRIVLEVVG